MTRVLLYAHSFAPAVGGAERLALELADGLTARFAVTVVTRTAAPADADTGRRYCVVRNPGFARLWALVREADVVHLAGPALAPLALSALQRRPVVIEHHAYQAVCPNGLLLRAPADAVCDGAFMAGRYLDCVRCRAASVGPLSALVSVALTAPRRWLARRAAAHVAVSEHVGGRLRLARLRVIRHGVVCPPSVARGDGCTVGVVGRLVREKGVAVLLAALARVDRAVTRPRVLVIGDGPERARLERLARELGLAEMVRFTGTLVGAELEAQLMALDVLVVPSIWEETAGFVALDGMARGTAVCASDIGGLGEAVRGAGVVVPPGDAGALAAALATLLRDPDARRRAGDAGRRRAAEWFDASTMIRAHAELWNEVAGR
jgi:glycosyltransferase involved in cell wall biosynthesis